MCFLVPELKSRWEAQKLKALYTVLMSSSERQGYLPSVTFDCSTTAGGVEMFYANMNQWQFEQTIQHTANKVPTGQPLC